MRGSRLGSRITAAVIAAAVLPVTAFGVVLLVTMGGPGLGALVLTGIVGGALLGLAIAGLVVGAVTRPVRQLGDRLDRIRSGQSVEPLPPLPDDEVGRLAERQEEMAADLARRNRQVARAVDAITAWSPGEGSDALLVRAAADARDALGLTDARIVLGHPHRIEFEERVPGDPHPVRAELRTGRDVAGVLAGHAPATARWEPADQDLLELYAASLAVALRDADLLAQVEAQNERLVEIDAEKDDFLRGVSHNLQTPLARIRANADQLAGEQAATGSDVDRRLAIISEQSERLSRMVRQLLTVSRLDTGALHPVAEVFALGPRVRRAWEALGAGAGPGAGPGVEAGGVAFELVDEAGGWLVVADPDQVDQVVWALLDNAVKHGGGAAVAARVRVDAAAGQVRLTVEDGGPGVASGDRERLFARYARGGTSDDRDGTGLGLYVGRALARANGGELALEEVGAGGGMLGGAAFLLALPAEQATEA